MTLADKMDALEAVVRSIEQNDAEVRAKLLEFSGRIANLAKRSGVDAKTDDFTLEDGYEPQDRVYGYLLASSRGVSLCTRSVWQDVTEDAEEEDSGYKIHAPETWPIEWLRVAATPEHFDELVNEFTAAAEALKLGRVATADQVRHVADNRTVDVEENLIAAAKEFDFSRVSEDWGRAQRALLIDPPAAITAACTLLESTFKHILSRLNTQPKRLEIQGLYKEAALALGISNDDGDAEVRGFISGVATIVQNVGSLRTKIGDAHGKGPGQRSGTVDEARLAVNMAGSASTYLIRRLAVREKQLTASAGPSATTSLA